MKNLDPIREKILNAARLRMIKFGYRKVTMDEIARDLKMSKNTIYKYFASKEKIAGALFSLLKEKIEQKQDEIKKRCDNPLEIISETVSFLKKELSVWFSPFMSDIEIELPGLWKDFVGFRTKQILDLESLIKSAIKKKLFRSVNPAIAVRAYLGAIDNVIEPEVLEQQGLSFSDAIESVMDIWSKGVVKKVKTQNAKVKIITKNQTSAL